MTFNWYDIVCIYKHIQYFCTNFTWGNKNYGIQQFDMGNGVSGSFVIQNMLTSSLKEKRLSSSWTVIMLSIEGERVRRRRASLIFIKMREALPVFSIIKFPFWRAGFTFSLFSFSVIVVPNIPFSFLVLVSFQFWVTKQY